MYFTQWLLQRLKRTLFGTDQWSWVKEYRKIILYEKGLAVLVTFGLGLIYAMIATLVTILGVYNGQAKEVPSWILWFHFLLPVAIFVYNWVMALYEVFQDEQQRIWNELKDAR